MKVCFLLQYLVENYFFTAIFEQRICLAAKLIRKCVPLQIHQTTYYPLTYKNKFKN